MPRQVTGYRKYLFVKHDHDKPVDMVSVPMKNLNSGRKAQHPW